MLKRSATCKICKYALFYFYCRPTCNHGLYTTPRCYSVHLSHAYSACQSCTLGMSCEQCVLTQLIAVTVRRISNPSCHVNDKPVCNLPEASKSTRKDTATSCMLSPKARFPSKATHATDAKQEQTPLDPYILAVAELASSSSVAYFPAFVVYTRRWT